MTHKLEQRSTKCVFFGYSGMQSAYKCLEPTTNKIYVSRHVQFVPHISPFATRHVLSVPRQQDVSFHIMSRQPASSLPTMPHQLYVSLPIMLDDVIVTLVPLADPPQ
ncbi:hypothetical protein V6N11_056930 [Hibiscus sabdariffa]|uniref:Retroviral polymerase SH3-like domain-containing protein n=1 Tax=Hibiscus sabdariffa TaxID=183260 RepID=A0ABR2T5M6_9ROSI